MSAQMCILWISLIYNVGLMCNYFDTVYLDDLDCRQNAPEIVFCLPKKKSILHNDYGFIHICKSVFLRMHLKKVVLLQLNESILCILEKGET